MAFVITEPCVGVKDASCVDVCPVSCIKTNEDSDQYYIDPARCTNCNYCEPVCPVSAILMDLAYLLSTIHTFSKTNSFFHEQSVCLRLLDYSSLPMEYRFGVAGRLGQTIKHQRLGRIKGDVRLCVASHRNI